uniref:CCC domain-containing protein n=1 Tax=Anopheles farauti TaxID=69004 RepID=A0A1Y9H9I5_9DIPT
MAPLGLLRLLVVLYGAGLWRSARTSAALATNDVHLPEEQDLPHRRHHQPHQKEDTSAKAAYPVPDGVVVYHVEHEQTETDARRYVLAMTDAELHRLPAWCKQCNATLLHYCRSNDFLNDHCCCEYSHTKEQLPWIPHTCMRQLNERCQANAGSCSKYRAIKECCCDRVTKLEYKTKFSSASSIGMRQFWKLLVLAHAFHAFPRFVPFFETS